MFPRCHLLETHTNAHNTTGRPTGAPWEYAKRRQCLALPVRPKCRAKNAANWKNPLEGANYRGKISSVFVVSPRRRLGVAFRMFGDESRRVRFSMQQTACLIEAFSRIAAALMVGVLALVDPTIVSIRWRCRSRR